MATQFIDLTNKLLRRLNEVEVEQADFLSTRGVLSFAKDAINASIEQIMQYETFWPFNASSGTQVLTIGQEEYSWPANLKMPDWRSFFIERDDTLGIYGRSLLFVSRDLWYKRLRVDDAYSGTDGRDQPQWVFEKHGTGFGVSPSPDQAYTVSFDYWLTNTALVAYNDVSTIPSNFDEVIIQGALYHFYMFRDNSQQAEQAEAKAKLQLQHMRTILINKEDRMRTGMFLRASNYPWAENLYPL